MKKLNKNLIVTTVLTVALVLGITGSTGAGAAAPAPVDLLSAGNFVILTKAGITNVPTSAITGNIGVSPIDYAAITGFTLIPTVPDGTNTFSTSAQVTGQVFAADYTEPTPTNLGIAVLDMQAAYTDALSRAADATNIINVGAGEIGGLIFAPGVYAYTGANVNVLISTDVTLNGSATDVWIFQIPGTLDIAPKGDVASGIKVLLTGGAQASNVFWAVAEATTLGTYSTFNGNILSATNIAMQTGAVLNGRALSQTAVTLDANTVTAPDAVSTPITQTQKDLNTWVPISGGTTADVTYSTVDGKFFATEVPTGYTLVYYPNVGTYANYTGEVYPVVGTNMNLPMANDLNGSSTTSNYCTILNSNGVLANPNAAATGNCEGAKLWLVPDADISATINANGSQTINWNGASNFLFETGLMTYTIPLKPTAPAVTNDDTANTVAGMATGMEYKLDATDYVAYDAITFAALDFSGTHTLLVRVVAEGINPASDAVTLTFTTNSAPADTVAPVITIAPYTLTLTNQDITVNASTNEGSLNFASHLFTANSSFDFVATDAAGNVATSTVTITNIDKTPPMIAAFGAGPAVNLGTAGNFTILSKAGITTTGTTTIFGDIGVSPIANTAITGFDLVYAVTDVAQNVFSISTLVTGKVYAANYMVPTPANLGTAVLNMEAAYTDAVGRATTVLNTGTGTGTWDLAGLTLAPGVYTFTGPGNVIISTDVTLNGSATDVWIFQIPGTLDIASKGDVATGIKVILAGEAKASNIFWAVAGATTLGTYSTFEGNILAATNIAIQTGAVLNGRALAQTAVTLDANTVTAPVFTPVDTVAPVIVVHADVSASGAVVTYTSPATSDAVDGAGVATCLPASGSTFPIGNTTVTCNATDVAGNHALATTFTVTVVATPAPVAAVSSGGGGGTSSGGSGIPAAINPIVVPIPQVLGTATIKNGALVLDGSTIYLISNGQKRAFASAEEFFSYGFKFADVISNTAIKDIPLGPVMKALDGALVLDTTDNRTIYFIGSGGIKRGFVSAKVFAALGYKFSQAVKINLSGYQTGVVITSAGVAHPDGALVFDGKTVWWINYGKKQGFSTMAVFNSYGLSFTNMVKANKADLALPEGSITQSRDIALAQ